MLREECYGERFESVKIATYSLSFLEEVLQELHEGTLSCHLGEEKTLSQLKERFYWPGHWNDVQHWVKTCEACSTRKTATPKRRAPLWTVKAGNPMQVVAVDILWAFTRE